MTIREIITAIENTTPRSAWNKGVKEYALELLYSFGANYGCDEEFTGSPADRKALLDGAANWEEYSYGGCSLIYNGDIAERLCTASELKRTKNGHKDPNSRETWLDVQVRALHQAAALIIRTARA